MTRKFNWSLVFSIVLCQLFFGCKRDEVSPQTQYLVSSSSFLTVPVIELQTYLAGYNLASLLVDDAIIYKVTYKTTYLGQPITASGLVVLPQTTDSIPMLSFQRGTIVAHSEAPSALPSTDSDLILYAGLASPGFIAVIPDLIGFGSSSNVLHPYYVEEPTASAVLDMIRAAKELAVQQHLKFNGKLFLAGYSQGGYSTMAAHKAIEQNGLSGFKLIASFPAAGGYDVKGMQEYLFEQTTYANPFYIAFVALAYKTQYADWTHPLSDFFREPYADEIPGLFDGTKTGDNIDAFLTDSIANLIVPGLKNNIDTDAQYQYIVDAFNENSLTDWKPMIPMFMYHGDADVTVPFSNSLGTYQKLLANGASPSVISLTTLPGADHSSGVIPYIEDFFPIMNSLK
jgi:pimeloyl-ACP methyl ester carboxylesterase